MRDSGYARAANDWYVEDEQCVRDMLAVEPIDALAWDPFCGAGNIPRTIIAAGGHAFGSDIEDRGYGMPGVDFFATDLTAPIIVSNPAFSNMQAVFERALTLTTHKAVILARLAFLEGQNRRKWFQALPLARVLVSSRRLSMPPGGEGIKATGGTIAFAWYVLEHGHLGPPTLGWV